KACGSTLGDICNTSEVSALSHMHRRNETETHSTPRTHTHTHTHTYTHTHTHTGPALCLSPVISFKCKAPSSMCRCVLSLFVYNTGGRWLRPIENSFKICRYLQGYPTALAIQLSLKLITV